MVKSDDDSTHDEALNPALHRRSDTTHGQSFQGTDPMRTVSVQDSEEGSSWPMIWAAVAVLGVLVTVYLLVT